MWFKEFRLYFSYYAKRIIRRLAYLHIFLFFISIILFVGIIFPNMMHRLPIFGNYDKLYSISGVVVSDTVWAEVVVEVGGYKTKVDPSGNFALKFPSKNSQNIPVVISRNGIPILMRISFENKILENKVVFKLTRK